MQSELPPQTPPRPAGLELACEGLCVAVGDRALVDGVDLSLRAGEVVGLLGPNGSGKSTLLRALARLIAPSRGRVTLDGVPIETLDRRLAARTVGYLPQGARSDWPISVREAVRLGRTPFLSPLRRLTDADESAVARALEMTDTAHLADRSVTTLSGGERMRAMLARVLTGEPKLMLLDEPVTGLDPRHQLEAMELLRTLAASGSGAGGCGTLVVLHDLTLAARYCDRLAVLHEGRVVAEGSAETTLTPAVVETAFEIRTRRVGDGADMLIVPWAVAESAGDGGRDAARH